MIKLNISSVVLYKEREGRRAERGGRDETVSQHCDRKADPGSGSQEFRDVGSYLVAFYWIWVRLHPSEPPNSIT